MLCNWYSTISSPEVLRFTYFAHFLVATLSLSTGVFVYVKSRRSLAAKLFLWLVSVFSLWIVFDLIVWASSSGDWIMFSWSLLGLLFVLVFFLSFAFVSVFVCHRPLSLRTNIVLGMLLLPLLLVTPTRWNVPFLHLGTCEASENMWFVSYYHAIGLIIAVLIAAMGYFRYFREERRARQKIRYVIVGVELFLFSFLAASGGTSILVHYGYLTNFNLEPYGLFGMLVFLAMIALLIIRYKAFHIKLWGVQALIAVLILLSGFQLFLKSSEFAWILGLFIFLASMLSGVLLARSLRMESQKLALEMAHQNLKQIDRAKSEFIDIVSHQLRTPVSILQGTVSVLLDEDMSRMDKEQSRQLLEGIQRKMTKLSGIVDDIMKVTRVITGNYKCFQPVRLDSLVHEALREVEPLFKQKCVDCSVEIKEDLPIMVRAEAEVLKEALVNIFDNALKYTARGVRAWHQGRMGAGKIDVALKREGDYAVIAVHDNGIGIDESDKAHIFKKFWRAKNAVRRHADGTGLGLYIASEVVRAHHGKIWVESQLGVGATFFISLPIFEEKKEDPEEEDVF